MFIPLKDNNPSRSYPVVNITLILANVVVFLYQLALPPYEQKLFIVSNATIPARIPAFLDGQLGFTAAFLPLLTSMFLHSGLLHIAGNMLFLWIFGDNVEDFFGHFTYLLFYLACGLGAGVLHIFFNLGSTIPALGASGAISGVMGSYMLLYPRERITTLVFIFVVPIPAVIILGTWFLFQFFAGINGLGASVTGGVAVWAHIGGFILGVIFTLMARLR
jgi:membrane associated rhomboid family serine protease